MVEHRLNYSTGLAVLRVIFLLLCNVYARAQNNYMYDSESRLTSDLSEGIVSITWNTMSRVTQIIRADTSHSADLEFAYDGAGNRVMKLVKPRNGNGLLPQSAWTFTYYTYDDYNRLLTVSKRSYDQPIKTSQTFIETFTLAEQVIKSIDDGMVTSNKKLASHQFTAAIGDNKEFVGIEDLESANVPVITERSFTTRGNKNYKLGSHIDNVLTAVTDRTVAASKGQLQSDVLVAADYYPFGMEMPGRSITDTEYRYGFSGKEKDNEIKGHGNSYHFGARLFDARVSRWLSEDPLASKYPSLSPYSFVSNNPLMFVDPDGRWIAFAKNTSPEFKKQYYETVRYLVKHGLAKDIITLEKSKTKYIIAEGNKSYVMTKLKTIVWAPRVGMVTSLEGPEVVKLSPAVKLVHEMSHMADYHRNPKQHDLRAASKDWAFDTNEEERVIVGPEVIAARKLGEICNTCITREDHYGKPYETISPTSNQPASKEPISPSKGNKDFMKEMEKIYEEGKKVEQEK